MRKAALVICAGVATLVAVPAQADILDLTFSGDYQHQGSVLQSDLGDSGTWSYVTTYDTASNAFGDSGTFSFGSLSQTVNATVSVDTADDETDVSFGLPGFDFSSQAADYCSGLSGCTSSSISGTSSGSLGLSFSGSNAFTTTPYQQFSSADQAGTVDGEDEAAANYIGSYQVTDSNGDPDTYHSEDDLQFQTSGLSLKPAAGGAVSAAPEPATWALIVVAMAMMGWALRKRRFPLVLPPVTAAA